MMTTLLVVFLLPLAVIRAEPSKADEDLCSGVVSKTVRNTTVNGMEDQYIVYYATEDIYIGHYVNNTKHGYGICMVPKNHIGFFGNIFPKKKDNLISRKHVIRYEGYYENNKMVGQGSLFFRNGDVISGIFEHDRVVGAGVLNYSNGDQYFGEWNSNGSVGNGISIFLLIYLKNREINNKHMNFVSHRNFAL